MIIQKTSESKFADSRSEYRKLPHLNYSGIKMFDESRTSFYRKYVVGEPEEEKKSQPIIFGDLVDCLAFTPEEVHVRFATLAVGNTPKPQMKEFVDAMWDISRKNLAVSGEIGDIKPIMEEAFQITAFDRNGERVSFKGKSFDDVVLKFAKEGKGYYDTLLSNHGKIVVDASTFSHAEKTVAELKVNHVTAPILNMKNDDRYFVAKQLPITFDYNGVKLKSMCDEVIVDEKEKVIDIYDLKTTSWDVGSFDYNVIKNRYYLQWSIYYEAVSAWAKERFPGFRINPMKFIVTTSDHSDNPLVYTTSMKDLSRGKVGFTLPSGRKCKGLDQLLLEITWHNTFGIWNMSYEDFHNNGIRKVCMNIAE